VNNGLEKFTDLENKVYRAIELFKAARLQKEALEKELLKVKGQLEETRKENEQLKEQMIEHKSEREQVREKVESLLQNLETLTL
jgi:chromosome segregation ATPase